MFRLYNTLSRQKEEFHPIEPGTVRMYSCGPTVYDYAHIGNFRAFVIADLLKRYLRYLGYDVYHVMNITDVEDKIIRRLQEEPGSLLDLTRKYERIFLDELALLNVEPADLYPRATEHVEEMIELIERLIERGLAYERDGSVYFSISRFPSYGELARLDKSGMQDGISIDSDEYDKENARDFVLWKARRDEDGDVWWHARFGDGRPGWHLECSCMSMKYLGESFDIHTGGVDLIFPHHQNEIAQSEGATGQPFVRHWVHNEFLNIDDAKMSKSKGNFYRLRQIAETGDDLRAYRYLIVINHYRHRMNFTFDLLAAAKSNLDRFARLRNRLQEMAVDGEPVAEWNERLESATADFRAHMDDDLNTPGAIADVFGIVNAAEAALRVGDLSGGSARAVIGFLDDVDRALGIFYETEMDEVEGGDRPDKLPGELQAKLTARDEARANKNWGEADRLRDELLDSGVVIRDSPDGSEWSWA